MLMTLVIRKLKENVIIGCFQTKFCQCMAAFIPQWLDCLLGWQAVGGVTAKGQVQEGTSDSHSDCWCQDAFALKSEIFSFLHSITEREAGTSCVAYSAQLAFSWSRWYFVFIFFNPLFYNSLWNNSPCLYTRIFTMDATNSYIQLVLCSWAGDPLL